MMLNKRVIFQTSKGPGGGIVIKENKRTVIIRIAKNTFIKRNKIKHQVVLDKNVLYRQFSL